MKIISAQKTIEGAGFVVARPIPQLSCESLGPFILLDHIGPAHSPPGAPGAPTHPHAGIETLSYFLEGEGLHQDSLGNKAITGAGEAQWMRAGRGIIHDEGPSPAMARDGGPAHAVQLWLNMPGDTKSAAPEYQSFRQSDIPQIIDEHGCTIRVIAGSYDELKGPLDTYSSPFLIHVSLAASSFVTLQLPALEESGLFLLDGCVDLSGQQIEANEMAIFNANERTLELTARVNSELLILGGSTVSDDLVRYGPFVANSEQAMHDTIARYQRGEFGVIE